MIKFFSYNFTKKDKGFSLVEVLISVAVFSLILLAVISFFLSMNNSNAQTKAAREAVENVKSALEKITYEIKSATSIYTPTTTQNQLSLETSRYLPSGEDSTFIDFFLCGTAVCFKKESQDAIAITSDSVQATSLVFSQISTEGAPSGSSSVQVSLTANNFSLTSTASLRSY